MNLSRDFLLATVCMAMLVATARQVEGSVAGYEFSSVGSIDISSKAATTGYVFQTNQDMTVTDLGVYDHLQDGLIHSHEVGLWEIFLNSEILLASTTVQSGTGSTLDGHFRYAPIVGVDLIAEHFYVVGAAKPSGDPTDLSTSDNIGEVGNGITVLRNRFISGEGLLFPRHTNGRSVLVGGNFKWEITIIPEPTTLTLAAIGLVGLCYRRRRRP